MKIEFDGVTDPVFEGLWLTSDSFWLITSYMLYTLAIDLWKKFKFETIFSKVKELSWEWLHQN